MIATGVIKTSKSMVHLYTVNLPVGEDKKQRVGFYVDNPNDISYYMRQAMDCGESVAGLFYFSEQDQFAHYLGEYEQSVAEGPSVLVDAVIEEIKKQIEKKDLTSIDELLRFIPKDTLLQFLPEAEWNKYRE